MRLFFCLLLSYGTLAAQDLYDLDHARRFADYLFKSGEYGLAAEEYERVVYLAPGDATSHLHLVQAYRLGGDLRRAQARIEALYGPADPMPMTLAGEYGRVLIGQSELAAARRFLAGADSLPGSERLRLRVSVELLDGRWARADSLLYGADVATYQPWRDLAAEGLALRRTSPALAVGLSLAVPGLGKAYAGYWKDGLFSLLFTGVAAWQSYRGFRKGGIDSVYGWVFAGVGTGFYIGNLYGSAKAAQKRNRQRRHNLMHRVEDMVDRAL
ncbi:MAG: hypothetical protein OHK0039_04630 [Bacteroidia bacterium]